MEGELVSESPHEGIEIIGFKDDKGYISNAELEYYDNPIEGLPKVLYIKRLYTLSKKQKNGYASEIMDEISTRVKEGNLIGLLKNGIKGSTKEKKFYENRGWEYLSEDYKNWMYFLERRISPKERDSLRRLIKSAFPPED